MFLMKNYKVGDKIHLFGVFGTFPEDGDLIYCCILGFSRGAYTARALAGMLYKVNNLPSHYPHWINRAVIPGWPTPEGQHRASTFCIQTLQDLKE